MNIYRIKINGQVEWVDLLVHNADAMRYIVDCYLYDAPVGERYFAIDSTSNRVTAQWRVDGGEQMNGKKLGEVPSTEYERVAVMFETYSSPSLAAKAGHCDHGYTYDADVKLKLTIGDLVKVPVSTRRFDTATVVRLNAVAPMSMLTIKKVVGRV